MLKFESNANMSNSWEVVGKNQKKSKIPQQVGGKKKTKVDPDSLPRIDPSPPLKESPTIYDAFIEKQPAQPPKPSKEPVGNGVGSGTQKKPNVVKKKTDKNQDKRVVKVSLEEVVKQIDVDELEAVLVRDQDTFPDNPALWLMDMASLINLKLDQATECDPTLEGKANDYPLCLLPGDCKTLICDTMKQCSSKKLEGFLEQCIQHMVDDMAKGISTHGYRMFVQLVAKENSTTVSNCLPKYLEIIKNNQNRHVRCLSVMWAVGQVGQDDFQLGLKVWFTVMLPFLNIKSMADYIVKYLENLFKLHPDWISAGGCISEKLFFQTFDLIHDPAHLSLPSNLQKKLISIYPNLKKLAMAPNPDGLSKLYFPSFLKRCEPNCREVQQKELLNCLMTCLMENKLDFSQWRQMYTKHMPQSGVLLNHISESWKNVGRKLDRKSLKENITAFSLTNEDLAKKGKNNPECDKGCKAITAKMSSGGFPWFSAIFFCVLIFAGVIAYDVYIHKSFKGSRTRKILSDSGMLVHLEQAWSRTELYAGKAWVWLQLNVPQYYARMCVLVGPYLTMFWDKLLAFGIFMIEVTEPARNWLAEKVPIVLNWVNEQLPWLWEYFSYYSGLVVGFLVKYSLIAWDFICHYSFITGVWLQENVFTGSLSVENIQKVLLQWLDTLRTFIQYCVVRVSDMVTGVNKS